MLYLDRGFIISHHSVIVNQKLHYGVIFIFLHKNGGIILCFYDNLSELCKINGITVSGLLAELKMSASNKQKWQNGASVNSSVLMKIADYFNVSVDYLLGRTDNSTVLSESYIGGDNNGIQAIKNRGSVTIRQTAEKENNCKEIEVLLEKMPRSKQLRAIADIIDLLEEKYQEE